MFPYISFFVRVLIYVSRSQSLFKISLTDPALWQYGLSSFQAGGIKLERFLPKNQHTQRILLNFE